MTKIVITGVTSFIGRNYSKLSKYSEIDKVSLIDNHPQDIDFSKYDVVLHLAAVVHAKKKIPKETYLKINRDLCIEVAKQAKKAGVKQFVFFSTIKVYGKYKEKTGPWSEDSTCLPDDYYGLSKYEAEIELKRLEDNDFIVSIVRPPLVYGEGVPANMLSIIKLVDSFPVLPFKSVKNARYFVSIDNLVLFIDQIIMLKASGVFIVCDDKPLSTSVLVTLIAKYLNKRVYLMRTPEFIIKIGLFLIPKYIERLYGSFFLDNTKTLQTLKIKPIFSAEESIKKMIIKYCELKKNKE